MAKKKAESIQDILDRIQEDIDNLREKIEELESDVDSDFDDEEDEDQINYQGQFICPYSLCYKALIDIYHILTDN